MSKTHGETPYLSSNYEGGEASRIPMMPPSKSLQNTVLLWFPLHWRSKVESLEIDLPLHSTLTQKIFHSKRFEIWGDWSKMVAKFLSKALTYPLHTSPDMQALMWVHGRSMDLENCLYSSCGFMWPLCESIAVTWYFPGYAGTIHDTCRYCSLLQYYISAFASFLHLLWSKICTQALDCLSMPCEVVKIK